MGMLDIAYLKWHVGCKGLHIASGQNHNGRYVSRCEDISRYRTWAGNVGIVVTSNQVEATMVKDMYI